MNKLENLPDARTQALEARFALRVGAHLHHGAAQLPHDISERLRVARMQALAGLPPARVAVTSSASARHAVADTSVVLAGAGPAGTFLAPWSGDPLGDDPLPWRWKLASALPVVVLVLGLWGIHVWHKQAQVQATTEVDMALLTDELPPDAYADPGFAEFLRQAAPETASHGTPLKVDDLIHEALTMRTREASS